MLRKQPDDFMNRVRHALTLPIRTRCAELTVLLDRGSTIELQNLFPLLIDSIFGPQGTVNWGLRTTCCVNEDFRQLQHFLSPCGPFFKLIYTLLKDPSAKYDFPVSYLPLKVQQILENAQAHPFYADLVHVNPQTRHVISLLLNPFDYYMFHFAYHLINPWHQRNCLTTTTFSTPTPWNTVYYVLSCDYILHFLPTDPSATILPSISYHGKTTNQPIQTMQKSPVVESKLINITLLNQRVEDYSLHQNLGRNPRTHTWRSETVLTLFIDMWLNNDQISPQNNEMNNSFNTSASRRLLHYNELPTGEYMRIVRVLIKQLHAFSASAKTDDTHLSELKKMAIPMLQGKFYIFLRNLIHRWPLDGSFRLVLELWLTYIQPWRYTPEQNLNKQNNDFDDIGTGGGSSPVLDRQYLPFIAENLLVYIVIFQQLLPRFSRVDLVSPKISIMLYRISKVFNQPNLASFLKEIENSIVGSNQSPSRSFSSHWLSNLPPLNATTNWCTNTVGPSAHVWSPVNYSSEIVPLTPNRKLDVGNTFMNTLFGDKKWSSIVQQKVYELEGPAFCYKPLFVSPTAAEVCELVVQLKKSIVVANEIVHAKKKEEEEQSSFWRMLKSVWEIPSVNDEFSLNERLKVPVYLQYSLENLMQLFEITEVPSQNELDTTAASSASNAFELSSDFSFLSPEKVRERIKKIKYQGDPDLHPIRSNEVKVLVRMFYEISVEINKKYQTKFCQLYYSQGFLGRLSRQLLSPPITIYKYDKTRPGSPRVGTDLPPRISLRYFASYNFLSYFLIGGMVFQLFGYTLVQYLFFVIFICGLYKCIKAISSNPVRHNYPTQGFGNISFDDSF